MLTVPTFSLSYRFVRNLDSVAESGLTRICSRRATMRVRLIAFVSEAEAPTEEFLTMVAALVAKTVKLMSLEF